MAMTRRAFTLIELLIVVLIIGIMASMLLFAVFAATDAAKEKKTRSLISKLDAIVMNRWEGYRTRRVPVNTSGLAPPAAAKLRLNALRELMKYELPDRWTDITDSPVNLSSRPSVAQGFYRKYAAGAAPSTNMQDAECLYLIVMQSLSEEGDARDVFKPDDVRDTDGDGFPEFIDAWQQPIRFLRWPAGKQDSQLQIAGTFSASGGSGGTTTLSATTSLPTTPGQFIGGAIIGLLADGTFDTSRFARVTDYQPSGGQATVTYSVASGSPPSFSGPVVLTQPDPFDAIGADRSTTGVLTSFAIYPMIYSAGSNQCYGVTSDFGLSYKTKNFSPFVFNSANGDMIGANKDYPSDANYVPSGWLDNIHNHQTLSRR